MHAHVHARVSSQTHCRVDQRRRPSSERACSYHDGRSPINQAARRLASSPANQHPNRASAVVCVRARASCIDWMRRNSAAIRRAELAPSESLGALLTGAGRERTPADQSGGAYACEPPAWARHCRRRCHRPNRVCGDTSAQIKIPDTSLLLLLLMITCCCYCTVVSIQLFGLFGFGVYHIVFLMLLLLLFAVSSHIFLHTIAYICSHKCKCSRVSVLAIRFRHRACVRC